MAIIRKSKKVCSLEEKISSRLQTRLIATKVLSYFRFTRRCFYVATEVGVYNSDVLAITPNNKVIEIEVKNSIADFKNEFKKGYRRYGIEDKIKKHNVYAKGKSEWVPNYFYFAGSPMFSQKMKIYLDKIESPYGVIEVENGLVSFRPQCRVIRRAKALQSNVVNDKVRSSILYRMSSEIIGRRKDLCSILYKRELEEMK